MNRSSTSVAAEVARAHGFARPGLVLVGFTLSLQACLGTTPTAGAVSAVPQKVVAQGRLEPASGIINVGALPGEQVAQLHVRVGDAVNRGQVLATMASRQIRQVEYDLAEIRIREAERKTQIELRLAEARYKAAELKLQKAQLDQEQVQDRGSDLEIIGDQLQVAQRDLERLKALQKGKHTREVVTPRQMEQLILQIKKLAADRARSGREWAGAKRLAILAVETSQADLEVAHMSLKSILEQQDLESLKKGLLLAKLQLQNSQLMSPIDGVVLQTFTRVGEHVANAPVLQVGALDEMVCVVEVFETSLQHIRMGQIATMTSAALPRKLTGRVVEIGQTIGTPKLRDPNPLARVDRKTGQVKVALDAKASREAAKLVNLQVNVEIMLGGGAAAGPSP